VNNSQSELRKLSTVCLVNFAFCSHTGMLDIRHHVTAFSYSWSALRKESVANYD
jgi:hypothetical protein